MTENMKKFLAFAKENAELTEKHKKGFTIEELTALAKEQGITLTEEDFTPKKEIFVNSGTELSDEELNDAAGGKEDSDIGLEDNSMYAAYYKCSSCGRYNTYHFMGNVLFRYLDLMYDESSYCHACLKQGTLFLEKIEKVC